MLQPWLRTRSVRVSYWSAFHRQFLASYWPKSPRLREPTPGQGPSISGSRWTKLCKFLKSYRVYGEILKFTTIAADSLYRRNRNEIPTTLVDFGPTNHQRMISQSDEENIRL